MSVCTQQAWRWVAPAVVSIALVWGLIAPVNAGAGTTTPVARSCAVAAKAPRQLSLGQLRGAVLCLVNRARASHGLPPLRFNRDLGVAATRHSVDMVSNHYFSHDGPRGGTVTSRATRTGYLSRPSYYRIGENIGGGSGAAFGSPRAIVRAWMHSPPHRANILTAGFRDAGVGVARGFPPDNGARAATYTLDLGARG